MYTTAPMGMMQVVQAPAPPASAPLPQAQVAVRLTPDAVMGMLPGAQSQPQNKQTPMRTAAQIQAGASARSPESVMFDVELQEAPQPQTPAPTVGTQAREAATRLLGGRDSELTTQFMVQEDMGGEDIPEKLDALAVMQRAAQRRAQRAGNGLAPLAGGGSVSPKLGQTMILAPTLPSLARPNPMALMPSSAYLGTNGIVRNDPPGSVMNKGQTAYRKAMERLGQLQEQMEQAAARTDVSQEELAAV